jgi:hypothetical protein
LEGAAVGGRGGRHRDGTLVEPLAKGLAESHVIGEHHPHHALDARRLGLKRRHAQQTKNKERGFVVNSETVENEKSMRIAINGKSEAR